MTTGSEGSPALSVMTPATIIRPLMTKRALIVDDSRSARVILSRMLEGYGLQVDSSEIAPNTPWNILRQTRPDVIFMDHLMPGMDGFQAIQAIKGNPDTAMIPVVMYTSQEGELYVSQARALGAVGVLPKTVKQADVSRVLYQLRLLPERREARAAAAPFTVQETAAVRGQSPPVAIGEIEAAIRSATAPLLKEHNVEMRRFVLASLEAFARRIGTEMKPAAAPPPTPEPIEAPPPPPPPSRWPLVAAIAALALLPTFVLAVIHTRTLDAMSELAQSNTQARRGRRRTAAAAGSFAPSSARTRSPAGDGSHGADRRRRRTSKPSRCRTAKRRCPVRASSGCAT